MSLFGKTKETPEAKKDAAPDVVGPEPRPKTVPNSSGSDDEVRSFAIGTTGARRGLLMVQVTAYPYVSVSLSTSHARFLANQLLAAADYVDEINAPTKGMEGAKADAPG